MGFTSADVLPKGALDAHNAPVIAPAEVAKLFQSNDSLKKLCKALNARRCRVVAPPTAEMLADAVSSVAPSTIEPLRGPKNAARLARARPGWEVVRGFCILELSGATPRKFIALKHSWNALASGAWFDVTPLVAPSADDASPRPLLLVESALNDDALDHADASDDELALEGNDEDSVDDKGSGNFEARLARMLRGQRPSEDLQMATPSASGGLQSVKAARGPVRAAPASQSRDADASQDALAGVNAERSGGHVQAGPSLLPLRKPSAAEATAMEAFRSSAAKMAELEQQQQAAITMANMGLHKVCGANASVAHMGVVDGRLLVALDGAVPKALVEGARDALEQRAAFRRVEQSSPNADQRHLVTDHDAAAFCATPLYERISMLVRLFFPAKHALTPARIYTNAMMFGDVAHIHRDGGHEGCTALLYANERWDPSLSGETMFFSEQEQARHAILPKPGRLLLFVASIKHCGRPPSRIFWGQRLTLAIKFVPTQPEEDKAVRRPYDLM